MSQLIDETYLTNCSFLFNANKFFHICLYDDGVVTSRWGRVGVTSQSKSWNFGSDAKRHYDKKIADKLKIKTGRDAYTKVDILTSTNSSQSTPTNLEAIATRDIDVDSETTRDLIRWLSKVNVHNIVTQTTMTYNETEGVFRTPLGVVGKTMVDRARDLLDQMSPFVTKKQYDDANLVKLASEYLRLIPQNLGAASQKIRLDAIFTDTSMKQQQDILDALDASIISVLTNPETCPRVEVETGERDERVFDVKLHLCDDSEQRQAVEKLFNHTKQSQHTSSRFNFKNLYTLDIGHMRAAWEQDGAKLDNRMRLWHGTSAANLLSILKVGLIIPKKYTNGWAYGAGIYFSDQSTKSLNYASGFWTGTDEGKRIFMFLADVGMGKYYVPSGCINKLPPGYDSCFAEAGKSGIMNHEMVVFRHSQCNLVYLVEFTQ